jgi:energy-coupling factor transport system permease protein
MINLFNYIERDSFVHRLSGATKLSSLILLTFAAMTTFDTRFLFFLTLLSLFLFRLSKIKLKEVRTLFWFTFVFMVLNNLLIYLFAPEQGVAIYGARHLLWKGFGRWTVTAEQLFYHLNVILKYISTIPLVTIFLFTTDPSEFASSLSRIGVSYRIAYSVSLALRYIPDIQREYRDISLSQQARGLEMAGKKEKLGKRLKSAVQMMFPLIISSMDRIEVISNAMELRGFGKGRKRTWYSARPFTKRDVISIAVSVLLLGVSFALYFVNGGRYYNPFI